MRGLVLWSLLPTLAQASDLPARLTVQRAIGAEQCPERSALESRVESIVRRPWSTSSTAETLAIDVRFERASDGAFVARVAASGPKPGQRLLRDANPTCDALGEAVSVAIALLLDSALSEAKAPRMSHPNSSAEDPTPASDAAGAPSSGPERWQARAAIEAGGGYGLGGGGALLGGGRFGARHVRWLFDLGLSGSVPTDIAFDGGTVRTSLLFGSARACYVVGHAFSLGPCAELGVGRLRGEGRGYGQVQTTSLAWTAGGLGLAAEAPLGGAAELALAATLWVPTRRQTFSVENAGIAWESKPVMGLVTVAVWVSLF